MPSPITAGPRSTRHPIKLPRAFRLLGYALCFIIAAPELVGFARHGSSEHGAHWWAAYVAFVFGFHLFASAPSGHAGTRLRVAALTIEGLAIAAMAHSAICTFAALTLVVVALEAALFLSPVAIVALLGSLTGVISFFIMRSCGTWECISWMLAVSGFQAAVAVAVVIARNESRALEDLTHANTELRAARALLAESARTAERHRIARELHDSLGHNLTAVGLHLEVARSVAPENAAPHMAKASQLADQALADVRTAVGEMRKSPGPDIGRALRHLCADAPGLTVHLDLPEPFVVDSAERAHCVVRCVQEVLTNAMRHSGAANLWVRIERSDTALEISARDDGRGADAFAVGNGLAGMRERLEELGGRLAIGRTPTFSLNANLPIEERAS